MEVAKYDPITDVQEEVEQLSLTILAMGERLMEYEHRRAVLHHLLSLAERGKLTPEEVEMLR